jgi:hypothetical protein
MPAMDGERIEARLGAARMWLRRLPPWVWRPPALATPGPAGLCLALLEAARPEWEGVAHPWGTDARPGPEAWRALPAAAAEPLLAALCAPWLSPEEEAEAEALEKHLAAAADFPRLSCAACRQQEESGEGPPACGDCPRTPPPPGSEAAVALHRLLSVLPPAAAPLAAELWAELPPGRRRLATVHLAALGRWSRALRARSPGWAPERDVLD